MASSSFTRGLQDLPTELLTVIAACLPAVDRIALSETCSRFQDVCRAKSVVKYLDCSRCYRLSSSSLKLFLAVRKQCENVCVLNLNYCYWLQTDVLLRCIALMKNIEELHLFECNVSTKLPMILCNLEHLATLSFTACECQILCDQFPTWEELVADQLSGLRSLNINVSNAFETYESLKYAAACRNLNSFELIFQPKLYQQHLSIFRLIECTLATISVAQLPKSLTEIKVDGFSSCGALYAEMLNKSVSLNTQWNKLWISAGWLLIDDWMRRENLPFMQFNNCTDLNLSDLINKSNWIGCDNMPTNQLLESLLNTTCMRCTSLSLDYHEISHVDLLTIANCCPNLTKLSLKYCTIERNNMSDVHMLESFKGICSNCTGLTELYLDFAVILPENGNLCQLLCNLKDLRKLSIAGTNLGTSKTILSEKELCGRREITSNKRTGIKTGATEDEMSKRNIWNLTESCRHIEYLEITSERKKHFFPSRKRTVILNDLDLACISRWTKLQHLVLQLQDSVQHGNFLTVILRDCRELLTLKLWHVGKSAACVYLRPLAVGLQHANSLKDLSIAHKNIDMSAQFLESLSCCSGLERLSISRLTNFNEALIVSIVSALRKLSKLVFVYINVDGTVNARKRLEQQILKSRFQRSPAFLCFIDGGPNRLNRLSKCPPHHHNMFYLELQI